MIRVDLSVACAYLYRDGRNGGRRIRAAISTIFLPSQTSSLPRTPQRSCSKLLLALSPPGLSTELAGWPKIRRGGMVAVALISLS